MVFFHQLGNCHYHGFDFRQVSVKRIIYCEDQLETFSACNRGSTLCIITEQIICVVTRSAERSCSVSMTAIFSNCAVIMNYIISSFLKNNLDFMHLSKRVEIEKD